MISRITFSWSGPLTPLDLHYLGEWLNTGIDGMPGHDPRRDVATITSAAITGEGYTIEVTFKPHTPPGGSACTCRAEVRDLDCPFHGTEAAVNRRIEAAAPAPRAHEENTRG